MQQVNQDKSLSKKQVHDKGLETPDDSSDDDVVDEVKVYKKNITKQRESISAEAYGQWNKKEDFKPQVVQKSLEMQQRIYEKLDKAFMFNSLNKKEKEIVMLAMEEKQFKAGDWVIKQGEEGNVLYVIDQGNLDCFKKYEDSQEDKFLKTYVAGESFGELALLYNAPRAASIQAKTNSVLFSLDRETFNHIVKDASMKKRQTYENILTQWSLLNKINDPYEKTKIADILVESHHAKGETIIQKDDRQGDIYLVLKGEIAAFKGDQQVFNYKENNYFGEIPIIFKGVPQPFTFKAVAQEETHVLKIPRSSYDSCLKKVEEVISENAQKYKQYV